MCGMVDRNDISIHYHTIRMVWWIEMIRTKEDRPSSFLSTIPRYVWYVMDRNDISIHYHTIRMVWWIEMIRIKKDCRCTLSFHCT